MATLSVTHKKDANSTATYRLTYTVSSTSTQTTLTLNSIAITATTGNYNINPQWLVIADGATLSSGYDGNYVFSNVTKTWNKGASSSSKTMSFQVGGTAATATISVPALTSYDVTYNANGGSGAPATQKKYQGQTLTLSTTKPTRANYVFKSWNTKADGTGTTYNPGASYTSNAALTLYAQWYAPYTVTFNANGGTGGPTTQTKVYNTNLTLTTSKPTRTGFAFVTWNTNSSGTGTNYASGSTYSSNANVTLYAIWDAAPSITSLTAIRCDVNGDDDDEGEYARVTCAWNVDNTLGDAGAITGTITPQSGGSTTAFTFGTNPTGSGTVTSTAIVGSGNGMQLDTDMQYTVSVTVANTSTGSTQSTSRNVILTRAFFTMDWRAGGEAIGIGMAAPESGLQIGFETTFNENVNVMDKFVKVIHPSIERGVLPDSSLYTKNLRFCDKNGNALSYFDGGYLSTGTSVGRIVVFNRDPDNPEATKYNAFTVRQNYDGSREYSMTDPDAFQAALGRWKSPFILKPPSSVNLKAADNGVTAAIYPSIRFNDSSTNDELYAARLESQIHPDGKTGFYLLARNYTSDGSVVATKGIRYRMAKDGTGEWYVSDTSAFCTAIGALTTAGGTSTGDIILKSTNINRDGANPSADTISRCLRLRDNDDEALGQFDSYRRTDGRIDIRMVANNEKTDGTGVSNSFQVRIDRSGNSTYYCASPANFRSAIGAAASSDKRLKSGIKSLGQEAVKFIDSLDPCVYEINGHNEVGLMAQDINKIDPWKTDMAFQTRKDVDGLDEWEKMKDGSPTWKLDYIRIIPPLVKALQEANRRISELESVVNKQIK